MVYSGLESLEEAKMAKKITVKELKGIIKTFEGIDIELVKGHINNGLDPNEILTIKWGNIYGENNPYTVYDVALRTQIWYLTFISETKKIKKQKASLEMVKYITPLITSVIRLKIMMHLIHGGHFLLV